MTNIFLAPMVGLIIILIDYYSKRTTDIIQRRVFTLLVVSMLAAMMCDLTYAATGGVPDPALHIINWLVNSFYFIFLGIAFSFMFLFLEYNANGSLRLKKIAACVGAFNILYTVILTLGIVNGKIFFITQDNLYVRGDLYAIVVVFPYLLVTLAISNVITQRKNMTKSQFALLLVSVLPAVIGSTLDLLIEDSQKIWPSVFISLLFSYLFIIRMTALIDSLTGIYNRRGCDEHLLALGKITRRKEYSFIMIDMDRFKEINDKLGHAQGDNALKDVAELLRASVRHSDFVARYGGDEFIIIAPSEDPEKIMEHIKSKIEEFNLKQARPYTLSLSCGGALYRPDDVETPQEFIGYVDKLMYNEKERRETRK